MAKVLYVVPVGQDMGGIITSSENLMIGFAEAGHKAQFCLLRSGNARSGEPRGRYANDYVYSEATGLHVHPVHGWRGPCYSTSRPDEFLAHANKFDIVVFGAIYGLRNSDTEGQSDWARIITQLKPKLVMMVRDDHLEGRIPWAMAFAPYVDGWAGVQQCSYDSLVGLGRRALVFSGHGPSEPSTAVNKRSGAVAIATWKPWKRGRLLLSAVRYMKKTKLTVAGDGIEFRYMRSRDKARDKDFHPDGIRIWDAAEDTGMLSYLGPVTEQARDDLLRRYKFMVDLSLRDNSGQINRVVIEAMRFGAIPVCDPKFLMGSEGAAKQFKDAFIPINAAGNPYDVARELDNLSKLKDADLDKMRKRNYKLVDMFSRKKAAEDLVTLAKGKLGDRKTDPAKVQRGAEAFSQIFGEMPK